MSIYRPKKGLSIKKLPKDLLPRERMEKEGAQNLSQEELWAIILGSGTKNFSVLQIASELTRLGFEKLQNLSLEELSKIPGVGKVKALTIKAVLELCRRHLSEENQKEVKHPRHVVEIVKPLIRTKKEHLFVVGLNISQKVVNVDLIALGSVNTVYAPTREVLQPVVKNGALFFILVHNHPDGNSNPSKEDILFTRKIEQAAQLLDVELLDHVIIGTDGYFSFKENGLL